MKLVLVDEHAALLRPHVRGDVHIQAEVHHIPCALLDRHPILCGSYDAEASLIVYGNEVNQKMRLVEVGEQVAPQLLSVVTERSVVAADAVLAVSFPDRGRFKVCN